jgi:hypothetical protein
MRSLNVFYISPAINAFNIYSLSIKIYDKYSIYTKIKYILLSHSHHVVNIRLVNCCNVYKTVLIILEDACLHAIK